MSTNSKLTTKLKKDFSNFFKHYKVLGMYATIKGKVNQWVYMKPNGTFYNEDGSKLTQQITNYRIYTN